MSNRLVQIDDEFAWRCLGLLVKPSLYVHLKSEELTAVRRVCDSVATGRVTAAAMREAKRVLHKAHAKRGAARLRHDVSQIVARNRPWPAKPCPARDCG